MITDKMAIDAIKEYNHVCRSAPIKIEGGSTMAMKAVLEVVFAMQEKELDNAKQQLIETKCAFYGYCLGVELKVSKKDIEEKIKSYKGYYPNAKWEVEPEDNQGWIEYKKNNIFIDSVIEVKYQDGEILEFSHGRSVNWNHPNLTHYRIKPNTVKPDTYIFNYSAKPLDMKLEIKYSDGTSERFPLHHEQYTVKSGVDVVSYGIVTESVMVRKDRQKEHKKKTLIEWIKAKEPDYIFDEGCAYLVKLISEYLDKK